MPTSLINFDNKKPRRPIEMLCAELIEVKQFLTGNELVTYCEKHLVHEKHETETPKHIN
jgi:hypothetical protein